MRRTDAGLPEVGVGVLHGTATTEKAGFEPAMEVYPPYPLSRRAP
jgi:hypothetical protein